jgi:hypothetical protein
MSIFVKNIKKPDFPVRLLANVKIIASKEQSDFSRLRAVEEVSYLLDLGEL